MMDDRAIAAQPAMPHTTSRLFGQKLIKTRFQLKFSLMIFSFLSAASFLVWLEGHYAVRHMLATGMVVGEDAALQLELLNSIIARTSVIALAITFGLALFFSHFVAGPVYRFERTLVEIETGNIGMVVKLRKNDEFKEVMDAFNRALSSLRNRVRKERDAAWGGLERAIQDLKALGATEQAAALEKTLNDLKTNPHLRF